MPVITVREQQVYGLPAEEKGVLYIVSGIVQAVAASNGRDDTVTPGRFVRNGAEVKGAKALVKVERKEDREIQEDSLERGEESS